MNQLTQALNAELDQYKVENNRLKVQVAQLLSAQSPDCSQAEVTSDVGGHTSFQTRCKQFMTC
jgi:hypothetical protein